MEIRVLGCHGSQLPGYRLTGFLIDAKTLIDAGAVTSVLTLEEQIGIDHVLLTHAHLDHIGELASLADNVCYFNRDHPLTVVSTASVIKTLKKHIFNGVIWPDFSVIPNAEKPVLKFAAIRLGEKMRLGHLCIMAVPVNHSVETVAYVVEAEKDGGTSAAVFVGDTGPTDEIWRVVGQGGNIQAIFVETSLPGEMTHMAAMTGHLTPHSLAGELKKLGPFNPGIYLYHMKLQYREDIRREVTLMANNNIHVLQDGQVIRI